MHFEFCSRLPIEYMDDLEALLFFNPQQTAVKSGILGAIEQFGPLQCDIAHGELSLAVGDVSGVQPLFALAETPDGYELAGVVLFVRTDVQNVQILHIAVTEPFSATGPHGDALLAARLVWAVRDSARRLNGVTTMTLAYGFGSERLRRVTVSERCP